MRLLILGGTQFLGRAIAAHATAIGHDVTCAARGVTGTVPQGARFIRAFLESQDIRRWSGPRSLPLWLPLPDYAGFNTRDTSNAREAGLTVRPLSETARDTLASARTPGGADHRSHRR